MKTVLITGACINTGVAIVEKFASEGYNVVLNYNNSESKAKTIAKHIENHFHMCYNNRCSEKICFAR